MVGGEVHMTEPLPPAPASGRGDDTIASSKPLPTSVSAQFTMCQMSNRLHNPTRHNGSAGSAWPIVTQRTPMWRRVGTLVISVVFYTTVTILSLSPMLAIYMIWDAWTKLPTPNPFGRGCTDWIDHIARVCVDTARTIGRVFLALFTRRSLKLSAARRLLERTVVFLSSLVLQLKNYVVDQVPSLGSIRCDLEQAWEFISSQVEQISHYVQDHAMLPGVSLPDTAVYVFIGLGVMGLVGTFMGRWFLGRRLHSPSAPTWPGSDSHKALALASVAAGEIGTQGSAASTAGTAVLAGSSALGEKIAHSSQRKQVLQESIQHIQDAGLAMTVAGATLLNLSSQLRVSVTKLSLSSLSREDQCRQLLGQCPVSEHFTPRSASRSILADTQALVVTAKDLRDAAKLAADAGAKIIMAGVAPSQSTSNYGSGGRDLSSDEMLANTEAIRSTALRVISGAKTAADIADLVVSLANEVGECVRDVLDGSTQHNSTTT